MRENPFVRHSRKSPTVSLLSLLIYMSNASLLIFFFSLNGLRSVRPGLERPRFLVCGGAAHMNKANGHRRAGSSASISGQAPPGLARPLRETAPLCPVRQRQHQKILGNNSGDVPRLKRMPERMLLGKVSRGV